MHKIFKKFVNNILIKNEHIFEKYSFKIIQRRRSNTRSLAERLQGIRKTAALLYNRMMDYMRHGLEGLKDIVEKEAEEEAKEPQQEKEGIDLTPHGHERALKRAYRSFVIPGAPKTDIDGYFDQTKPHIKMLIKNQLKEMSSTKTIMTIWVRWKKPIEPLIELNPEYLEDAKDTERNAVDKGRPRSLVNPSLQEMDEPEKEEIIIYRKSRPVVKKQAKRVLWLAG